jgi:hypothetical protein
LGLGVTAGVWYSSIKTNLILGSVTRILASQLRPN